jgi:hypothetical protein
MANDKHERVLRQFFVEEAAGAAPPDLLARSLARTATARRRPGWYARIREVGMARPVAVGLPSVRVAYVLAILGLILAGLLAAVASGAFRPAPAPILKADGFVRSFDYVIPATSGLEIGHSSPAMYAFTEGPGDEHGRDASGQRVPGARGVTIAAVHQAVTHPCPLGGPSSRIPVREEPRELLDDLRTIAGIGLGEAAEVTFDGRPALAVTVDPSLGRCAFGDVHVMGGGLGSLYVDLSVPSRLILADVDGRTIALQAWAQTQDDLDAWLPIATEFLDSVHFTSQP